MFQLLIADDSGAEVRVPLLRDEITIGRGEGNTIRLHERNVSRRHARIVRVDAGFGIDDLDSYNGVKINEVRIERRTTLHAGDRIVIGDYVLRLIDAPDPVRLPVTTDPAAIPPAGDDDGDYDLLPAVGATPVESTAVRENTQRISLADVMARAVAEAPDATAADAATAEPSDPAEAFDGARTAAEPAPAAEESATEAGPVPDMAPIPDTALTSRSRSVVTQRVEAPTAVEPAATGDLPAAIRARSAESDGVPPPAPAARRGWAPLMVAAVLSAAAGGAAYTLLSPAAPSAPPPLAPVAAAPAPVATPAPTAEAPADEPVFDAEADENATAKRCEALMAAKKFAEAGSICATLPREGTFKKLIERAKAELAAEAALAEGRRLADDKRLEPAAAALARIPAGSAFFADAKAVLDRINPTRADELVERAEAHIARLEMKQAVRLVDQALGLVPGHPDAKTLKEKLKFHGDGSHTTVTAAVDAPAARLSEPFRARLEAVISAREAAEIAAESFAKKRFFEAEEAFRKALKIDPKYPPALRGLGSTYAVLNQNEKAVKQYKRYLKVSPDAPDAADVRRIIDQYEAGTGEPAP